MSEPIRSQPVREVLYGRDVVLGGTRGLPVSRTLPNQDRRLVGAWCFVDHFGRRLRSPNIELSKADGVAMRVGPHPHTGLQTVTWLLAGSVRHTDSLGSDQLIRPGQLNLMTAGHGIAHAEQSPQGTPGALHGVQLWVALPDADRDGPAAFAHHADLPGGDDGGVSVRVLIGELGGLRSPARAYTPIVGAEVAFAGAARTVLPLDPDFEHAVLVVDGTVDTDGGAQEAGPLLYLGTGRRELALASAAPARLLLLGGVPFEEELVMWWNFIGRGHDDIVAARTEWMAAGARFGEVHGYDGGPLPAPELPTVRLRPRPRLRRHAE